MSTIHLFCNGTGGITTVIPMLNGDFCTATHAFTNKLDPKIPKGAVYKGCVTGKFTEEGKQRLRAITVR